MEHDLRRTNPKGERGVYTCRKCGQHGHLPKFERWGCPMMGDEEIELLLALSGERDDRDEAQRGQTR